MFVALLAAMLSWLNPAVVAAPECAEGSTPLTTLSHVELWGTPQGGSTQLLAWLNVRFREGLRDTLVLDLTPQQWTVEGYAVSLNGLRSCPKLWTLNQPPVFVPPLVAATTKWYDITGRSLAQAPTRSGVYWMRSPSGAVRKMVILR